MKSKLRAKAPRGVPRRLATPSKRDFDRFCVDLGERIRGLRLKRNLRQEDMAERGFSHRHYQRIEAGRSVSLRTLWKLAAAFGVPIRKLLPPSRHS